MRDAALALALTLALASVAACGPSRPAVVRPPPAHPGLPPQLLVRFTDRMGTAFRLVQVQFAVDGRPVFDRSCAEVDDACRAGLRGTVTIVDTTTEAGPHVITAHAVYRGEGAGVFSYLRGYRFRVDSEHEAPAEWGRRTLVDATAWERGGPTTSLEERPAMDWHDRFDDR